MKMSPAPSTDSGNHSGEMIVTPRLRSKEKKGFYSGSPPKRRRIVYIDMSDEEDNESQVSCEEGRNSSEENFSEDYLSTTDDESLSSQRRRKTALRKTSKRLLSPQKSNMTIGKQTKKKVKAIESSDSESADGEEEYCVEKIINMKVDKHGNRYFYVKWLNYDSSENTWEPEAHLENCKDVINDFLKGKNNKRATRSRRKKVKTSRSKKARKSSGKEFTRRSSETKLEEEDYFNSNDIMKNSINQIKNVQLSKPLSPPKVEPKTEWLDELIKPDADMPRKIGLSSLFYFKVICEGKVDYIYIDITESQSQSKEDELFKCVVTEDLTGKQPKFIYGATTSVDGDTFCLVQFEGHVYIEVVPPDTLFRKFPTFKRFFEVHCPNHFPSTS